MRKDLFIYGHLITVDDRINVKLPKTCRRQGLTTQETHSVLFTKTHSASPLFLPLPLSTGVLLRLLKSTNFPFFPLPHSAANGFWVKSADGRSTNLKYS